MLERTAATLEPCTLQRVLPSSKGAWGNPRQLRHNFWQHGAGDADLLYACQVLLRTPLPDPASLPSPLSMQTKPEIRLSTMTASAFLLDFLYPQGAATLLRRIAPTAFESREQSAQKLGRFGPHIRAAPVSSSRRLNRPVSLESKMETPQEAADSILYEPRQNKPSSEPSDPGPFDLRDLLQATNARDAYGDIWAAYSRLDQEAQAGFRNDVLLKLSESSRDAERSRVSQLFSLYAPEDWTEDVVRAIIDVEFRSGNPQEALSIFREALESKGFVTGLDPVLAHALDASDWNLAMDIWKEVSAAIGFLAPSETRLPAAEAASDTANSSTPASEKRKLSWSIKFTRVSELENFEAKAIQLYTYIELWRGSSSVVGAREKVDSLLEFILRNSLELFPTRDAMFLVERTGSFLQGYPRLILSLLGRREGNLAAVCYRKYRQLSGAKPGPQLLNSMVGIFFPLDIQGMEQVREDWRQIGDKGLTSKTYKRFMAFYARNGDVRSLYKFWDEHHRTFEPSRSKGGAMSEKMIIDCILEQNDGKALANFMRAHAEHGDIILVESILRQALEKLGRPPTTMEQNILLQAHAKERDYEGALRVFTEICDGGKPDTTSFSTIMRLAGKLGDLEFCVDMDKLAKRFNVNPNAEMVRALVEAYCQNERYREAEVLCHRATQQNTFGAKATRMWNALLNHHGRRRDLTTVNRLLGAMSSYELHYDTETYDHLLNTLVNCKQSHHALHLLHVAEEEGVFEPTLHHYLLLMTAFIRSGEPHMVLRVHDTLMKNKSFPESADRVTKLIAAYGKWAKMPRNKHADKSGQWFVAKALDAFKKSLGRTDRTAIDDARSVTLQYSKMVSILAQARDFGSVQDIVDMYKSQFHKRTKKEELPLHLLSSMMLADYYDRRFSRAKNTWELIMKQLTAANRPARDFLATRPQNASSHGIPYAFPKPSSHGAACVGEDATSSSQPLPDSGAHSSMTPTCVSDELASASKGAGSQEKDSPENGQVPPRLLPGVRYYLNEPLKTMQRILVVEQDADGLKALITRVTEAGFAIDNANWNYYIQAQARLRRWAEAFKTCEKILMPHWSGWFRMRMHYSGTSQVPLDSRRLGQSPSHLRPISHTLLVLAKEYLDMEKISSWSPDAAQMLKMIGEECPRVVKAVTTVMRDPESQLEKDIFDGTWRPELRDLAGEVAARRPFYDEDMARERAARAASRTQPSPGSQGFDADGETREQGDETAPRELSDAR